MGRTIPEDGVATLLRAVESWGGRGTATKIAASTNPQIPLRRVRRWLEVLVREKRVLRLGASSATRYKVVAASGPDGDAGRGAVGGTNGDSAGADADTAAVRQLLSVPARTRTPVLFQRVVLDRYCPNETTLLPAVVRARWDVTAKTDGTGAGPEAERRRKEQIWALISRSRAVEQRLRLGAHSHGRGMQEIGALKLLDLPDVPQLGGDIRRVLNHRDAFQLLLSRGRAAVLSLETVGAVYATLTRPAAPPAGASKGMGPKPRRAPPLLRTRGLVVAGTSYQPPADPTVIAGSFRQILGTAAMVSDPLEQAFMLYAQLLLVLPFGAENVSMAALTANIPLLRAGLKPMTLVGADAAGMVTALAAWWELGRVELLAQAVEL